jgi:predicted cupin superfamily sugar epimerase
MSPEEIVAVLDLEPLPEEGGLYRQVWATPHGTAIYFLITPEEFSAMHRLGGPEIWHHYAGAPARMLLLHPDGTWERPWLGDDLRSGQRPMQVVEAGTWMGAETTGEWTLLGTTMAPPYHPAQFQLGVAEDLMAAYPAAAADIGRLARAR